MNHFLRSRMPKLFNHFAKADPWISTLNTSNWEDGDRLWPYVLLARAGRSLVPAILNGHIDPTVSDFRDNSGRPGCPSGERVVFLAAVKAISEKTMSKWAGSPSSEDEPAGSSEEDMSIEVISPPRRPITRSVSAKRAAGEMELEDNDALIVSSPPRPRKVRKVTGTSELPSEAPLFARSPSPETIEAGGVSDAVGIDTPFRLDKDYFESENPWEEKITYF